jgi:hypothetical protein
MINVQCSMKASLNPEHWTWNIKTGGDFMRKTPHVFLLVILGLAATSPAVAQITMHSTPPPSVTAENEAWYVTNEPVVFAGNNYYPAGPSIHFLSNEMVLSGFFRGVPLYTRTTIEPYSVVFVPVAGGLMRPFERRRSGDLAGTTGSSVPSLRVEIPTAFSPAPRIQAAGPPFVETSPIVSESPAEPPSVEPESGPLSDSGGVATGGRLTAPRGKRVGRPPANGVYVEFNNQRWYSSVPLAPLDPATFRQVGEWHGFPVYTWARTGPSIIYIPVAQGSDAYAAYSRKQ